MATTHCFCSWVGDSEDYDKHLEDAHGGNASAPMTAASAPSAPAEDDDDKPKASARR